MGSNSHMQRWELLRAFVFIGEAAVRSNQALVFWAESLRADSDEGLNDLMNLDA